MENTKKSSYSLVVAVACCLVVFGGAGTVFSTAGIFYSVVADAFGVGKGTFSLYMTITCLVMSFSLPVLGKLLEKLGVRKLIALNGVCITASWVIFALSQNMWMFYVAAVLQGFGVAGPMYFLVPTMAARWFHQKSGTMIGIAMAFTGIAGIILQPVLGAVITSAGWRVGYWVNAALSAVLVILPALFLLRNDPAEIGQVPYGYEEVEETAADVAAAAATPVQAGVSLAVALKSPAFYMVAIIAGAINIYTCVNFYWASYATAIGFSTAAAAGISSAAMYGQLVGKIGIGAVSDKNVNLGMIAAYGCGFVGLIAALFLGGTAPTFLLLACIFIYGISHGSAAVETPIVAKACFGTGKDYAQIYANIASVGSFCAAIGSTLFGFIIDLTGSYVPVFVIGFVLCAVCFITAKLAIKSSAALPREV